MKQQVYNPYLPSWEYVPDGEPHVFGNRVYVYGSHDRFGAPIFCVGDYVCWSAPVEDLSEWRYEGVIYRKNQDPANRLGLRLLFAPDVCQGGDGRYYLYYAFDFMGIIGVAVCDSPAGQYEYYGRVHDAKGTPWGRRKGDQFPFDPAVLRDNDGKVWLYSGFATSVPAVVTGGKKLRSDGGTVVELAPDMVTMREQPRVIFPKQGKGAFPNHEFFEASSIRQEDGVYLFVYSSRHNHELCYATSNQPGGGFVYGGTLVSLGDLFLHGQKDEAKGVNYLGNTHGGLLHIGAEWYIFYHRQTNRHSYSRQACAERLIRTIDGGFQQAEVTSCGLNGGALKGEGYYEARIACNLWSKDGVGRYDGKNVRKKLKNHPYFTQTGKWNKREDSQYIANMRDGAVAGFRYFEMQGVDSVAVTVKGSGGVMQIAQQPDFQTVAANIKLQPTAQYQSFEGKAHLENGVTPLFFRYQGEGHIDFQAFQLNR